MKQLKLYQKEGAVFLATGGVMLACVPGAGKTLQAIAACQSVNARTVLIVCPAIALTVWRDEILDCWPLCTPVYLRDLVKMSNARIAAIAETSRPLAIVTGYEYLLVNQPAQKLISAIGYFDVLILDEAHAAKNPTAKRTMLIYGPGCDGSGLVSMAKHVWLLTATPMLNHPGELFPHIRALSPERVEQRSYQGFTNHYCVTKTSEIYLPAKRGKPAQRKQIEVFAGANRANLPELAKRLRGFWLRRPLSAIVDQLPRINLVTRRLPPEVCDATLIGEAEQGADVELLRKALESGDANLLSTIESQVSRLRRLLALAKVEATVAWAEDLFDQGIGKVAIWGIHTEPLAKVTALLAHRGAVMIDGSTPTTGRAKISRRFQTDPGCKVFVGQIQAAGTAIDLDATKRPIFLEQAWTPALNHQAIMRHIRVAKGGVLLPVLGEALAVDGSIDMAVQEVLARKTMDIALLEGAEDAGTRQ